MLILYVTGKSKVFLALVGLFCSCLLLVKHQWFLEMQVLSKGSKVGLRNVYLAAFRVFSTWDYAF